MAKKTKKTSYTSRNLTMGAAALSAVALAIGAAFRFGRRARTQGHTAPDLALDAPVPGTERAPEAFRPDLTAPVSASERDALRPATMPVG